MHIVVRFLATAALTVSAYLIMILDVIEGAHPPELYEAIGF